MWDDVLEAAPSDSWAEVPENGWGALMGWAAGTANLRRRPASDEGRTVAGTLERGGVRESFEEPFTDADRQVVDDSIDEYLQEAGLPPRPRGYVWMIRGPAAYATAGDFVEFVDLEVLRISRGATAPADLLPAFEAVLRSVYDKA